MHRHHWEIESRNFNPPISDVKISNVRGSAGIELMARALFGVTFTTLVCTGCGYMDVRHDIGDTRPKEGEC